MSKARDLADLLDSSGDVKSAKLDNVPTYSDVTDTASGLMKKDHKIKLAGIETGATADQTKTDIEALGIELPATNLTGTVADARISTLTSSKLTGDLPAIDGSSLTGIEGVPSGIISMWSGAAAAIPSGWNLCDGNNGTPNLVGKFIKGGSTAGTAGGSGTTSSNGGHTHTGPSHTHSGPSHTHSTPNHSHSHSLSAGSHTLSTSQMPSHNHFIFRSEGGSVYNNGNQYSDGNVASTNPYDLYTGSAGGSSSHSHSLSGSISSGGSGTSGSASGTTGSGGNGNTSSNGSHTHTIEPVHYTLCYIMKS